MCRFDWSRASRRTDGPNQIAREGGQRRIAVYSTATARATARKSSLTSGAPSGTTWPQGYSATLEGSYQAYEEASRLIGIPPLASLALIFVVLQSRYRFAVLALIVMVACRLALIGAWLPLDRGPAAVDREHDGFCHACRISTRNGI